MADNDLLKHFFCGFVGSHIAHQVAEASIYGVEMIEELGRHGDELSPRRFADCARAGQLRISDHGRQVYRRQATSKGKKLLREARGKLRELFQEVVMEAAN